MRKLRLPDEYKDLVIKRPKEGWRESLRGYVPMCGHERKMMLRLLREGDDRCAY